jgi:hypothetical protein
MRFLISTAEGSLSPATLFGPEVVDMDDIAESIDEVRGIVAWVRGSTLEWWEDVEDDVESGVEVLFEGFETGPAPGLVRATFRSTVSRPAAGPAAVLWSMGECVDFSRKSSGSLSTLLPRSCARCAGNEGMVGDWGFELEGVVGAEPTPLELDRGGRPSDPR